MYTCQGSTDYDVSVRAPCVLLAWLPCPIGANLIYAVWSAYLQRLQHHDMLIKLLVSRYLEWKNTGIGYMAFWLRDTSDCSISCYMNSERHKGQLEEWLELNHYRNFELRYVI
jgi:hypothetical protein